MEPSWVQLNVGLARPHGDALASARAVFAELAPQIAAARDDGTLRRFFFMRKPPDLRLRLEGPEPERRLVPAVSAALAKLECEGVVTRFFPSVYEPEIRLFGGPEAMALVHDHFDADTAGWMEFDRLWADGAAALEPHEVACAVANELFVLALDDGAEVWDTWSNVLALVAPSAPSGGTPSPPLAVRVDALARATPPEAHVLERYRAANEALAEGLRGVWTRGRLECGLREMLPFVALFHLHRYGLDAARQARVAGSMQHAWSPRSGLHASDRSAVRGERPGPTSST